MATLNEVNPKRIVATCPHCYQTLGKEYHQFGGHYNVVHHTQFIRELIARPARLEPARAPAAGKSPTTTRAIWAGTMASSTRHAMSWASSGGDSSSCRATAINSFCCGAGGAQMWKEEEHGSAAVNVNRYQEAAATGATTIAVGCPFCLTMLTDAAKQADEGMQVKDIAELVADRIG